MIYKAFVYKSESPYLVEPHPIVNKDDFKLNLQKSTPFVRSTVALLQLHHEFIRQVNVYFEYCDKFIV